MRFRAKVDANHSEIVGGLRQIGASVRSLAQIGKGLPDLLVGFRGKNFLFEVKDGSKTKSQKRLTQDEEAFFETWKGAAFMVESLEEAIAILMRETICRN
jgi:hypothetical protein